MVRILLVALVLPAIVSAQQLTPPQTQEDTYQWLENIKDTKSLSWVQQQNAKTLKELTGTARFNDLKKVYVDLLNKKDFLQIWRDEDDVFYLKMDSNHPRGILMKVARADFKGESSPWQILIDFDQLSATEKTSYIYSRLKRLHHSTKALVSISVQGRDEVIVREFDLAKAEFVKDGLEIPVSKTDVEWIDQDNVLLAYNEGADSLTRAGYPRRVRLWKRGQNLKSATLIKEFPETTVGAGVYNCRHNGVSTGLITTSEENGDRIFYSYNPTTTKLVRWPLDARADVTLCFNDKVLLQLERDWTINGTNYVRDSIIALKIDELDQGQIKTVSEVFKPNGKIFPQRVFQAKNKVFMIAFVEAQTQLLELTESSQPWDLKKIAIEKNSNYSLSWSDEDQEEAWFRVEGYTMPKKLIEMNLFTQKRTTLQEQKINFSLKDIEVTNNFAISKDGTKVPYATIALKQVTKGPRPTLQYGYGGFRVSETPFFSEGYYRSWILRGGVFVNTYIRGGLEFGEEWHQQAIREKKQNVFDDFIAISEDLIQKKITTPEMLSIQGGSNGGLLVSAVAVQRPDLYKAVVCQVPLTDMLRFHKLLAGASWIEEYGDPDNVNDRAFLEKYSPYQNVKAGVKMPKILFMTSTNDDRVHPGHARKMAAKMIDLGHQPLFYEETEGGHTGGVPVEVKAAEQALIPEFLSQQLNLPTPVSAH